MELDDKDLLERQLRKIYKFMFKRLQQFHISYYDEDDCKQVVYMYYREAEIRKASNLAAYTYKCILRFTDEIVDKYKNDKEAESIYAYKYGDDYSSEDIKNNGFQIRSSINVFEEVKEKPKKVRKKSEDFDPDYYEFIELYRQIPKLTIAELATRYGVNEKTIRRFCEKNFVTRKHLGPHEYLEMYAKIYGKNEFYYDCLKNIHLFDIKNASQRVKSDNRSIYIGKG